MAKRIKEKQQKKEREDTGALGKKINWNAIVDRKRREAKLRQAKEALQDPGVLPKNYNSLKYMERVYAGDAGDSASLINHTLYKKMMPCPLRSQIESAKTRVTVSVADGKDPRDTDLKLDYI